MKRVAMTFLVLILSLGLVGTAAWAQDQPAGAYGDNGDDDGPDWGLLGLLGLAGLLGLRRRDHYPPPAVHTDTGTTRTTTR